VPVLHIEQLPLWLVFAATCVGFSLIYFGVGAVTQALVGTVFPRLRLGRIIAERALAPGQIAREIKQSLVSILIFGGYGVATAVGVRAGLWSVVPSPSPGVVALELAFLVLWNDLHFYVIHRALHGRWLFQHVHREHHRAIRPTPYSTYAMHPVEAALLGSVMVLVQPFHAFSLPTLILFPLVSIAMNNLGHMNYDLVPRRGVWHPLAATRRHERHHRHVTGNYGFLLPVLDRWLGTDIADSDGADAAPR
jgi:sterol desaturase/sphingolipid hydroxylase (fatty acid hydroxylase superfamily)